MDKFTTVRLKDLGRIITGKTPSSSDPKSYGQEYLFITPSDNFDNKYIDKTNRYLSEYGKNLLKSKLLKEESVLVTCIGSAMGKVAMNSLPAITNQQINSIEVNELFNSHYIYYCLKNNYSLLRNAASGSTALPILNKTDFEELTLQLYRSLFIQKSIANILSTLDQKIAINNQINAQLEQMAKTLYDYWFVQFDFPDENGKPYKSSGGEMVYNETLKREIPKGWGVCEVQECLDKVPNTTKVPNKEILQNGLYPVIDQSQEYICGFTNDDKSVITPKDAHIIFGDHTRIVKLVNFPYSRGADGTQVLISNAIQIPNYLLYQIIKYIDLSSYGYARHFKFLKEQKIIKPAKDISQGYQRTVNPLFEQIKNLQSQNQQLAQLRDFLLPMLMNGQVGVGDG